MFLPRPGSDGDSEQVTAALDHARSSQPAAGGTMSVLFDPVPLDTSWQLERVVVSSTSSLPTRAYLFTDLADPRHLLDGTNSGNFDVADNTTPVTVGAGLALLVVWLGAADGAVGTVRVQGTLATGSGGP